LESFEIGGEQYFVVANHKADNSWDSSSFLIDSKVYKWTGTQFEEVQSSPTTGAYHWESFEISGERYLAVANYYDGSSFNIRSKVYKFSCLE